MAFNQKDIVRVNSDKFRNAMERANAEAASRPGVFAPTASSKVAGAAVKPPTWLGSVQAGIGGRGTMGDATPRPDWYNQDYQDFMAGSGPTYDNMFKSAEVQAKIAAAARNGGTLADNWWMDNPMGGASVRRGGGLGYTPTSRVSVPDWLVNLINGNSATGRPDMSPDGGGSTDMINTAGQDDPHHLFDPLHNFYGPQGTGPLFPWWPTATSPTPPAAPPPTGGGGGGAFGGGGGGGRAFGGRGGGGGGGSYNGLPSWLMNLYSWNFKG